MGIWGAYIGYPSGNYFYDGFSNGSPGIAVMGRAAAAGIQAASGWTKKEVKNALWENSKISWSVVEKVWRPETRQARETDPSIGVGFLKENEPWPITSKPEEIMIVVAGGQQSGHGYWMQIGTSFTPTCKEIRLPIRNWEELLKKAEKDLGPSRPESGKAD